MSAQVGYVGHNADHLVAPVEGNVTLARYETGSLQSEAHDATLKLVEDPRNVRRLLDLNRGKLSADQIAAVEARLAELTSEYDAILAREETAPYSAGSETRPVARMTAAQATGSFLHLISRVLERPG